MCCLRALSLRELGGSVFDWQWFIASAGQETIPGCVHIHVGQFVSRLE